MIIITVRSHGWQCSCDNDFRSTLTGGSAQRESHQHALTHTQENVEVRDMRVNPFAGDGVFL